MDTDYDVTDHDFDFQIATAGGVTDINPIPSPPHSPPGLYSHGHARIKKRGGGRRRITWHCDGNFSIQFEPLASDSDHDPDSPGDIWTSQPLPTQQVGNEYVFSVDLRRGTGNETVAYKYTVYFGVTPVVDPVIIIDR